MARFKDILSRLKNTPEMKAARVQMKLALMLDRVMRRRCMTKADLAEQMNCSRSYVTQALRGDKNFSILSLAKFATVLDCEISVNFIPKDIYEQNFERIKYLIKTYDLERNKLAYSEAKSVQSKQSRNVDLTQVRLECESDEAINLAA
ncbi:helix-turn-helix domain-containing protein [Microbulbifer sp. SSSA005]|uniref:helix-turn-helix domain-containing protein n=1 Tax=Microbulbifer sp. SSSA005 TaxID=3243378 RepID=UPI0040391F02